MMESISIPQFTSYPGASVAYDSADLDLRPTAGIEAGVFGRQRLPSEAVGSTTATFDGVVAGSEIRVYLPDTTEAAGIESCATNQALSWDVYAAGSPNNTVRIVIIHPDYRIKEFNYTATLGAQSIPIQLEPDKWYSNPA